MARFRIRDDGTRRGTASTIEGVCTRRRCRAELFTSTTKFASHCGWPSFADVRNSDTVELLEDRSHGMVRTEVRCARCGSHLGHLFKGDGYTETNQRYCINSISMKLQPTKDN